VANLREMAEIQELIKSQPTSMQEKMEVMREEKAFQKEVRTELGDWEITKYRVSYFVKAAWSTLTSGMHVILRP
jgi:hypothetical protein